MNRKYYVVANRSGHLSVAIKVDGEAVIGPGETVLKDGFATIDDAFDWRDDMQSRIDAHNGHCATC